MRIFALEVENGGNSSRGVRLERISQDFAAQKPNGTDPQRLTIRNLHAI